MSLNQLDNLQYKQDKVLNVQAITHPILFSVLQNMFLRPAGFFLEQGFNLKVHQFFAGFQKLFCLFISSSHLYLPIPVHDPLV